MVKEGNLTMHSTHYIYSYMAPGQIWKRGRKEGNVLFNDAFNTLYVWLYGSWPDLDKKQWTVVKEGNVLFNDALNTLYLWLYGSWPNLDKKQWIVVKEGNVLFNNAFNTLYVWLYGSRPDLDKKQWTMVSYSYMASAIIMVKDHSDRERGNPLPPHGLLFPIRSGQVRVFNVHIQSKLL